MPENKRTIGYLCPVCGKAVVVERSEFQLAASDSRLPCPCGKSELTIRQMGDHCEITVPCVCCAKDHTAACSNDALLHQRLMFLSCSASGLGCCYIGQEDAVFQAMEQLEQAVDNIEKLHRLLRGMAKWDREVLVEDEFAILDAYLGIQSSRFEQRLSYELKLDDSLKKQYILAFILQPLVENAVIHGCETQRRRTKITVEGFLKEGRCYFVVSDDGKGMTEEQLKALREKLGRTAENENQSVSPGADGHIGLENVNKRIQIHYGSCYGIRISSQPDAGTTCRVELPLLEKECEQDVPSITG